RLRLEAPDGSTVDGLLRQGRLVLVDDGQELEFTREPGATLRPPGAGGELRVPRGWGTSPARVNGQDVLAFPLPRAAGRRHAFHPVMPLGRARVADILARGLRALVGDAPTEPVVAPEIFTVGGRPAARTIVTAAIPTQTGERRV